MTALSGGDGDVDRQRPADHEPAVEDTREEPLPCSLQVRDRLRWYVTRPGPPVMAGSVRPPAIGLTLPSGGPGAWRGWPATRPHCNSGEAGRCGRHTSFGYWFGYGTLVCGACGSPGSAAVRMTSPRRRARALGLLRPGARELRRRQSGASTRASSRRPRVIEETEQPGRYRFELALEAAVTLRTRRMAVTTATRGRLRRFTGDSLRNTFDSFDAQQMERPPVLDGVANPREAADAAVVDDERGARMELTAAASATRSSPQ